MRLSLQLWKSIDSGLILNTNAVADENGMTTEYKSTVQCPACPKTILANYKAYSVGGRMRKRKIAKEKVAGNRRPSWYITNLQTHLITCHIQDRILHEVSVRDEADLQDAVSGIIDYEPDGVSNGAIDRLKTPEKGETGNAIDSTNGMRTPKTVMPARASTNHSADLLETPKKSIVNRFFAQLQQNQNDRSSEYVLN